MTFHLTQHRISSIDEFLFYLQSGNTTVTESLELDLSVGYLENGSAILEIGHPVDLRHQKSQPTSAKKMFTALEEYHIKQIIVDVKARRWNSKIQRAEFDPGDQDFLYQELPLLLSEYQKAVAAKNVKTTLVVGSVMEEFFRDAKKQNINFGKNIKTRFFARDKIINPLQQAVKLNVNQVGLEFPKNDRPEKRLAQLLKLSKKPKYAALEISFYTVDDSNNVNLIRKFFPEAEIITNSSSLLEKKL